MTTEQQKLNQRTVGITNILRDIQDRSLVPTEFANAMFEAGFSPDWDLRDNELAIIRLAIKRNLRCFGFPSHQMKSKISEILTSLGNVYQRYLHN
jgi:hypothetical protein